MIKELSIHDILKKSRDGGGFSKDELTQMLSFPPDSIEAYAIMAEGHRISKELCGNKAEVHAQFALNLGICPRNCKFCSFAAVNAVFETETTISADQAVAMGKQFETDGANAVYIMSTANYPFDEYIEISTEVRKNLQPETTLVANVGDRTPGEATKLKDAGFQGVYHAMRLREGVDTGIPPEKRVESLRNFREAGLKIGTCVEPVGPEHTNEELAEMILFTDSLKPRYSGAARRIAIPGTEMERLGMISELRMAQVVAVTRLGVSRDTPGNCTHEPCALGATGGSTLLWAEVGANPRDVKENTEEGRGETVDNCRRLFREAELGVLEGPSMYYS